jgi:hypothetical protein
MRSPSWRRFLIRASKSPLADKYEPLWTEPSIPLQLYAPRKPPKALLLFTKPFLCKQWLEQGVFPEDLFILVRYGLPSAAYWKEIKDVTRRTRLPLCFVGDLDPLDLTAFVALRSGDPELRRPDRRALEISYCGVDDSWLTLCERNLLPRWHGARPLIRMSPLEQEHRDVIFGLAPWLLECVGPRSGALLRDGLKLELEGASNPAFYGKDFPRKLLGHLRQRARR